MRDLLTSLLDVLGLLLFAAAVAAGLHSEIGWWSLAPAGLVVLGGSQLAAAVGRRSGGTQ